MLQADAGSIHHDHGGDDPHQPSDVVGHDGAGAGLPPGGDLIMPDEGGNTVFLPALSDAFRFGEHAIADPIDGPDRIRPQGRGRPFTDCCMVCRAVSNGGGRR